MHCNSIVGCHRLSETISEQHTSFKSMKTNTEVKFWIHCLEAYCTSYMINYGNNTHHLKVGNQGYLK